MKHPLTDIGLKKFLDDWAKLGEQCGLKMKRQHFKGETYVSAALPAFLAATIGGKDEAYLWAPDARTLVLDDKTNIKALIAAKAGGGDPGVFGGGD